MVLTPIALAALIQYALLVLLLLFVLPGGAARVASVHFDYYYDHTPHDNAL